MAGHQPNSCRSTPKATSWYPPPPGERMRSTRGGTKYMVNPQDLVRPSATAPPPCRHREGDVGQRLPVARRWCPIRLEPRDARRNDELKRRPTFVFRVPTVAAMVRDNRLTDRKTRTQTVGILLCIKRQRARQVLFAEPYPRVPERRQERCRLSAPFTRSDLIASSRRPPNVFLASMASKQGRGRLLDLYADAGR